MPDVAVPASRHPPVARVGWGFIASYVAAYMGAILLFVAPLLVSLSLKINSIVGIKHAPSSLSLVAGAGALLALFANPLFGKLSDRTSSRFGMRRPWLVGGLLGGSFGMLVVALAPDILVVLVGWCIAQLFFNALLAALIAVLPDQVPVAQRGRVGGVLGICLPIASVCGTYVVQLFAGNQLVVFLAPCALGGFFILVFAAKLDDRRLEVADRPAYWRRSALLRSTCPDRSSSAPSPWLRSSSPPPSSAAGSRTACAVARSSSAVPRPYSGLRCSWLPRPPASTGSWSAWPSAAMAPAILAVGHGSYGVLYAGAGICAVASAVAILPVKRVG